jgi:hypothetical protein
MAKIQGSGERDDSTRKKSATQARQDSSIPDPRFINIRGVLFLAHEHDFRGVLKGVEGWF